MGLFRKKKDPEDGEGGAGGRATPDVPEDFTASVRERAQSSRKLAVVIPEPDSPLPAMVPEFRGDTPDAESIPATPTSPSARTRSPSLTPSYSHRTSIKMRYSIMARNASVFGRNLFKLNHANEPTPLMMALRDACLELSKSVLEIQEKDYDFLKDGKNSISALLHCVEQNMDAWLYNPELIPRLSRAASHRGSMLSISSHQSDDDKAFFDDFQEDDAIVHALERLSSQLNAIMGFFHDLIKGTGRLGVCGCSIPQLTMYSVSDSRKDAALSNAEDLRGALMSAYGQLRVAIKKYLIKRVTNVPLNVLEPSLYPQHRLTPTMDETTLDMCRISDLCYMNLAYVTELINLSGEEASDVLDEDDPPAPPEGFYIELGKEREVTLLERSHHAKVAPFISPDITFCDPSVDSKIDARMYVLRYKRVLLFAFRGTETASDILDDINAVPVTPDNLPPDLHMETGGKIKVHNGFYHHWKALETRVNVEIRVYLYLLSFTKGRTDPNDEPHIIFTGHSLGGAIATIAAFYTKVWFTNRVNVSVYTFGAPRAGNRAFARTFDRYVDKCQRVVYNMDPVAHVPPRQLGYVHTQGAIWIHEGRAHLTGFKKERARRMMKEYFNAIRTLGKSAPWADHVMVNYMNQLESIIEQRQHYHSKWRRALGYLGGEELIGQMRKRYDQTKEAMEAQYQWTKDKAVEVNKAALHTAKSANKKAIRTAKTANKKAMNANKKALAAAQKANSRAKKKVLKDVERTRAHVRKDLERTMKVVETTRDTGAHLMHSTVNLTPLKKRQSMSLEPREARDLSQQLS